ncbi:hypothetical protein VOLCADRAFT_92430 [Volvox carteri f. nagariensis]|uniref:Uncharacterized protein n=1 Tax=Volvox carteri f. nagariensis TaxID=3068 RepID=D8TZM9_VOLCA|nr:uncharacterized protein VOLCADRAFT_92430 [Volvox carteri f. nagariensis]EFJ47044.1 hypothetical protein VOLCADRAFT_92430 [Volvox carteri f. nagariensis]|eukprot:XP_002951939.1 hypothetical protein VOLCADRAFT_92430 [Volvox carteri f. nagariensis]
MDFTCTNAPRYFPEEPLVLGCNFSQEGRYPHGQMATVGSFDAWLASASSINCDSQKFHQLSSWPTAPSLTPTANDASGFPRNGNVHPKHSKQNLSKEGQCLSLLTAELREIHGEVQPPNARHPCDDSKQRVESFNGCPRLPRAMSEPEQLRAGCAFCLSLVSVFRIPNVNMHTNPSIHHKVLRCKNWCLSTRDHCSGYDLATLPERDVISPPTEYGRALCTMESSCDTSLSYSALTAAGSVTRIRSDQLDQTQPGAAKRAAADGAEACRYVPVDSSTSGLTTAAIATYSASKASTAQVQFHKSTVLGFRSEGSRTSEKRNMYDGTVRGGCPRKAGWRGGGSGSNAGSEGSGDVYPDRGQGQAPYVLLPRYKESVLLADMLKNALCRN